MTTIHGIERTLERTEIKNARSALRFLDRAAERGKNANEFPSREREWLNKRSGKDVIAIVYNGYCFITNKYGMIITMFELPHWFLKQNYDGKTQIRNTKRYYKMNPVYEY